ncbi:MAG: hypothetical protein AAF958_12395 [Planctomycetota bacterium]
MPQQVFTKIKRRIHRTLVQPKTPRPGDTTRKRPNATYDLAAT